MQVRKGTQGAKLYSPKRLPPDNIMIGTELYLPSGKGADAADAADAIESLVSHLEGSRFHFLLFFSFS